MAKKNDPDGPLHKWGEPEGVKDVMKKTPGQVKTIKVGEDAVGSNQCHYALVMDRKVTATGTKEEMLAKCAEEGGRVWVSTKNVGDIVEAKYSVDVDGLPRFYMDADSPAQVKKALRSLLRKASSIDSVERVNDARIKQDLRQRIKGADTDKRNVDEGVKDVYVMEKLDPAKHDAGDYVKDFKNSNAPQFKGKSMEKRRKMAIAAYLSARREKGLEEKYRKPTEEVELDEASRDAQKQMQQKTKARIKPEHHGKYDFGKIKNANNMLAVLDKAKIMKHLNNEEVEQVDEARVEQKFVVVNKRKIKIKRLPDEISGDGRMKYIQFEVGPVDYLARDTRDWQANQALKGLLKGNRKLKAELDNAIMSWDWSRTPDAKNPTGIMSFTTRIMKEEVEQVAEISDKLARKAAALSIARSYHHSDDSNEKKADKAYDHVAKRQGMKGTRKLNRLATKAMGQIAVTKKPFRKPFKKPFEEAKEAKDYNAEIQRQKDIASTQRGKMSKATSHSDMVSAMNRHMQAKKNQKSLTRAQAHKEEVEQVDELSNATHMSYSKKAGKQVSKLSTANKKWRDARNAAVSQSNKGDIDKATSNIDKNNKTIAKRKMGLARSYQSRSEEVEQVDESGVKSPPLKGVPVVSLSDVSNNSDYKKDRYGRRVPKRLKNNDPRVRFMNKEDVEQVDEISRGLKQRYKKASERDGFPKQKLKDAKKATDDLIKHDEKPWFAKLGQKSKRAKLVKKMYDTDRKAMNRAVGWRRASEEVEQVDENYSKKSTASLQKTHDKWKDRPMTPAMGNEFRKIRRELHKRGAMRREEVEQIDEKAKKGLWYNIHQKRKRGEKPNPPGHPDRPSAEDLKRSQKEEVEQANEAKISPALIAKVKKLKGKHAEMAKFLVSQGDVKELNKFMKQIKEEAKMENEQMNEDMSHKSDSELRKIANSSHPHSARAYSELKKRKQGTATSEYGKQVHEVSKDLKKRYLDKAIDNTYKKWIGKEKTTKQQLDKRRAAIQKVSQELKGRKHFSDLGEEDYGFKIRRYEMIKKAAKKIQRKAQTASKSDYKRSDKTGMAPVKTEARSYKVPSNYAAMMARKRKKAGTSEFGRHPDKKLSPAQSKHMDTDKDGDIDKTDLKNLRNKK